MTKIVPPKTCESCKELFYRRAPKVTVYKFNRMIFCSAKCRAAGNGYRRRGRAFSEEHRSLIAEKAKARFFTKEQKEQFVARMTLARENKKKNDPELIYGGKKENRLKARAKARPNMTISRLWRNAVLLLGNEKCSSCGSSKDLHADHIKPYSLFKELRYAIDNGRVLCKYCHIKTDTYGRSVKSYINN